LRGKLPALRRVAQRGTPVLSDRKEPLRRLRPCARRVGADSGFQLSVSKGPLPALRREDSALLSAHGAGERRGLCLGLRRARSDGRNRRAAASGDPAALDFHKRRGHHGDPRCRHPRGDRGEPGFCPPVGGHSAHAAFVAAGRRQHIRARAAARAGL